MEKIASLRQALVPAFTANGIDLERDPDRLKIFVDAGRLASRRTPSLNFQYRYTVRLFVEDFAGGADTVMVPLLLWLRTNQPDLLQRFAQEGEAVRFAADILDNGNADIALMFELSEMVGVQARGDGSGWDIVHWPEPSPDDPLMEGALWDVPLAKLYFGGVQLLPRPDDIDPG